VVSITSWPRFTPGQRTTGTHCTTGWVDPRTCLESETRGKSSASLGDRTPANVPYLRIFVIQSRTTVIHPYLNTCLVLQPVSELVTSNVTHASKSRHCHFSFFPSTYVLLHTSFFKRDCTPLHRFSQRLFSTKPATSF
jgi:hypothetical protein